MYLHDSQAKLIPSQMFLESHWQFLYECFFYTFFSKTVQKTLEKKRASRGGGEVDEFDKSDTEPTYSDGDDDITADGTSGGTDHEGCDCKAKKGVARYYSFS
jgi:hypothetical protein